jgi:transketolase
VREIEGHNLAAIEKAVTQVPYDAGRPNCIVAHTIKGKGVSFMENKLLWHYRAPLAEDLTKALTELEEAK